MTILAAKADPEKRLFIHLLTRDISLIDAFLDIIDNSVNAIMSPLASRLLTIEGLRQFDFSKTDNGGHTSIKIAISKDEIAICDNAHGISTDQAQNEVFRFGRRNHEGSAGDTLSVYGIGLKRGLFKMGSLIEMRSSHVDGGFRLELDVPAWEADSKTPWSFPITSTEPVTKEKTGTEIRVRKLTSEAAERADSPIFIALLCERIEQTYGMFLGSLLDITVNGRKIGARVIRFGDNFAADHFDFDGGVCNIVAGLALPNSLGKYTNENAGWFVLCNFRQVIAADKGRLTGWTGKPNLPIFQPKHRPFFGVVSFTSLTPERLPWTTTKAGINEDASAWQEARRRMIKVGRQVLSVLDRRYSDDGTEITSRDLKKISGKAISLFEATYKKEQRMFSKPKAKAPDFVKISYSVPNDDYRRVEKYMSPSPLAPEEVGKQTFEYYLSVKVGNDGT